jgi:hypothetical protein
LEANVLTIETSLNQQLKAAVTPLFDDTPIFILEDRQLLQWLHEQGVDALPLEIGVLNKLSNRQKRNIVLFSSGESSIAFPLLERHFKGSRLLLVPLFAFDPSLKAASYTIQLMARSDFVGAIRENARWVDILSSTGETLIFQGGNSHFTCALGERIQVMQPRVEPMLLPGEWEAIGPFFEVGMVPDNENIFHPGYVVNGVLEVAGVAIARHRQMPSGLVHLHTEAWRLMQSLIINGQFPLKLELETSRLVKAMAGDLDITEQLRHLSNEKLDLLLVEVAISNNPTLHAHELDWTINSVLNEGARGIHVAVGDGMTGAHIDFICPGVEVINA